MVEFLNVFIVPVVSFHVYARRFNAPLELNLRNFVRYCCLTVVDFLGAFFILKILEIITGIGAMPSSQFYTVINVIVAYIVPYIYEIYKKYLNIRCEIKEKHEGK